MGIALWLGTAFAEDAPVAAVLRTADRAELGVSSLSPSPDGALVLAYGSDRAVVLGDAAPRATVKLEGIEQGTIAKNGRFALVHAGGMTVHAADGREELRLGGFGRVSSIALSPDAKWVAIGSSLALELHDAVDGRLAWSKDGATAAVAFSQTGDAVLAEVGGEAVALGIANGKPVKGATPTPALAGFRPDGCAGEEGGACPVPGVPMHVRGEELVLVRDGAVERWRLLFPDQVAAAAAGGPVAAAVWAGGDLVLGLADGGVKRLSDGAVRLETTAPGCAGTCAFVGLGGLDGETWAAGPGGLQRWSAEGAPLVKKPKPTGQALLRRLPDGRWAALAADGRVRVGEVPGDGKPTDALPGAAGFDAVGQVVVAWAADGVVVAGADGSERKAPSLGPGRRPIAAALAPPDGAEVAIVDDQGALHVYRTADAQAVYRLPLGLGGLSGGGIAWSADGTRLVAGGATVRVFSAKDGKEVSSLTLGQPADAVAVSSSGRLLVRSGEVVRVVDLSLLE